MSGLTCTGVGLLVLTAAGLAVKAVHKLQARAVTPRPARPLRITCARPRTGCGADPAMPDPATVAVVVPAHNEAATIEQTLHSCLHQTYPVSQVIVVADNCTDATAALARATGVIVIEGRGGSKAAAQNLALPQVTADLVVALDGDNILAPSAVAHMVATMHAGHAGTCAAVLPKDTATIYSQYRTLYHALANGWTKKIHDALGRQLVLNGMANCHRSDVLRAMGGYPDNSVTEDFNLTWALHRKGYSVAFSPEALVYTQEPTSFREMLGQMHRWTSGFAQCMVAHRTPLLDPASFVVVVSLAVDALMGGLATLTFLPFFARHGLSAWWRWWSWVWILLTTTTIAVAISQLGIRTTLRCLPGWFILQTVTGPVTTWWLIREWVLGRHLTTWTGRHGRKPTLTPISTRRKTALVTTAALTGLITLAIRHLKAARRPSQTPARTGRMLPTG